MKRAYTYNLFRSLVSVAVLAAATAGLAACAKESVELAPDRGDGEIRITSSIDASGESKGVVIANSLLTGVHFLKVDGSSKPANMSGAAPFTGSRTADATGAIVWTSTAPKYDQANKNAYLVGIYPGSATPTTEASATGRITEGSKVEWTIDGKTDILVSQIWDAGTYAAPLTGSTTPKLTFEHQLAQLCVVLQAESGVAPAVINAAWGDITAVELLAYPSATYTYATAEASAVTYTGTKTYQELYSADTFGTDFAAIAVPASDNTSVNASGMFAPSTGTISIRITSKVGTAAATTHVATVELKDASSTSKDFEKGKKHTVTLTFGAKDKPIGVATTSIEAWADAGTGSGEEILPGEVEGPSSGIIDMRNPELIKSGDSYTITSTQESYNTYVNTESNAAGNGGYCPDAEDAMSEPAYVRFEVAKTDESVAITWSAAWDACKAKAPAGAWRLPRESELWVMYWNLEELKKTPGFSAFHSNDGDYYTSAVERTIDIVWSFRMIKDEQGHSSTGSKGSPRRVRCVREVPLPAVGNYYYADGSFSSTLVSGKSPNGVIYYVDSSDPRKFKVIALDVVSSKWAVSNKYRVGALSLTDGKGNSAAIKATFDAGQTTAGVTITQQTFEAAFPAAAHCYNYQGKDGSDPKGTWYLPALTDLQYLWCAFNGADPATWGEGSTGAPEGNTTAQGVFNGYLSSADGEEIISEDGYVTSTYWSSTEYKNPGSYTWYVRFFVGRTGTAGKNGGMSVRCVREN